MPKAGGGAAVSVFLGGMQRGCGRVLVPGFQPAGALASRDCHIPDTAFMAAIAARPANCYVRHILPLACFTESAIAIQRGICIIQDSHSGGMAADSSYIPACAGMTAAETESCTIRNPPAGCHNSRCWNRGGGGKVLHVGCIRRVTAIEFAFSGGWGAGQSWPRLLYQVF